MIHELRIYTTNRPAMRRSLVTLMERLIPVFERAEIKVVGLWTTLIGLSGEFYYLLEYESLADREKKWTKFTQDPDLQKFIAEAGEYPTVKERSIMLQPTSYSSLK